MFSSGFYLMLGGLAFAAFDVSLPVDSHLFVVLFLSFVFCLYLCFVLMLDVCHFQTVTLIMGSDLNMMFGTGNC